MFSKRKILLIGGSGVLGRYFAEQLSRKNEVHVADIFLKDDIIFATFSTFESGTILNPHRDPDVYPSRYKRIQIPIKIPDRNHCFMIWDDKKVTWKEGVAQTYPVMDVTHEGYNLSTEPMEFVMIDVKMNTQLV